MGTCYGEMRECLRGIIQSLRNTEEAMAKQVVLYIQAG